VSEKSDVARCGVDGAIRYHLPNALGQTIAVTAWPCSGTGDGAGLDMALARQNSEDGLFDLSPVSFHMMRKEL
jgi:hypothetical protein